MIMHRLYKELKENLEI